MIFEKGFLALLGFWLFYLYDSSKTHQQEAFTRAESISKLLPTIVDPQQNSALRAELLAHLMETKSISDQNAIALTGSIIRSRDPETQTLLFQAWMLKQPASMEVIVQRASEQEVITQDGVFDRDTNPEEILFLGRLFCSEIDRDQNTALAGLDDQQELDRYLISMARLVIDHTNYWKGVDWLERGSGLPKLLAAMAEFKKLPIGASDAAEKYVLQAMNPPVTNSREIERTRSIIDALHSLRVQSLGVVSQCLELLLRFDEASEIAPQGERLMTSAENLIEVFAIEHGPEKDSFDAIIGRNHVDLSQPLEVVLDKAAASHLERLAGMSNEDLMHRKHINLTPVIMESLVRSVGTRSPNVESRKIEVALNSLTDERLEAMDLLGFRNMFRASTLVQ